MRARLADERPRTYLAARGIPYDIAAAAGVGYIPADARLSGALAKWRDRLVFPLGSPAGVGYAGRSLHGWALGMDENEHKAWLDALTAAEERAAEEARERGEYRPVLHRRWEKTYPAGWFGYELLAKAHQLVVCEGPIDRLALAAAGLSLGEVLALVGTAARLEWIPANVSSVLLALDGDGPGRERAQTLRDALRAEWLAAAICTPPTEDGLGKDWAERWRRAGRAGAAPVIDVLAAWAVGEDTAAAPPSGDTLETPGADVASHEGSGCQHCGAEDLAWGTRPGELVCAGCGAHYGYAPDAGAS
jgi:hypothetical protein